MRFRYCRRRITRKTANIVSLTFYRAFRKRLWYRRTSSNKTPYITNGSRYIPLRVGIYHSTRGITQQATHITSCTRNITLWIRSRHCRASVSSKTTYIASTFNVYASMITGIHLSRRTSNATDIILFSSNRAFCIRLRYRRTRSDKTAYIISTPCHISLRIGILYSITS